MLTHNTEDVIICVGNQHIVQRAVIKLIIGNRIAEIRKERDMTQQQLADIIKIKRSSLGHIEIGTWNPSAETIKLISDALQKPLGEIFFNPDVSCDNTKQRKRK